MLAVDEVANDRLRPERTEGSPNPVRHNHEEPLCAGADRGVSLLVHEERS